MAVAPSSKVTVPVGMVAVGEAAVGVPETVAVKLTRAPARATGLETVRVTWVCAIAQKAQASSITKTMRRFIGTGWESPAQSIFGHSR